MIKSVLSRTPTTELFGYQLALLDHREQRDHARDPENDHIRDHQARDPELLMTLVDIEGKKPILNIATVVPVARIRNEGIGISNNGSNALVGWGGWVFLQIPS